jgi:hypothetical protein
MITLTRRRFFQHLALLSVALNHNALADDGPAADNQLLVDTLRRFLHQGLIDIVVRCGDDVVENYAAEAFRDRLLRLQWRGVEVVQSFLQKAMDDDIANDRTVLVDGWILMRTEALAVSSYLLLTEERYAITAQQAVEEW